MRFSTKESRILINTVTLKVTPMKTYTILIFVVLFNFSSLSQDQPNTKPKLVIGIVVDQMRNDYIDKFWNHYGEDGFKRLINQGYRFKNNHFNYVPTKTGPGHASIHTGTSPMNHGIVANNWFDKVKEDKVYCAGDPEVQPLGTQDDAGKMSPHHLLVTTIADENRLATQMRGKTIGISFKDRGAILPAGHTANAAYWFHGKKQGQWISSSYYMEALPKWVDKFNNSGKAKSYLKTWNTLYPIESYVESGADLNDFERGFKGKETATFPYNLKKLAKKNGNYDMLKSVAYGNDFTTDFAMVAIESESLGQDKNTDFLALSYSSPDYVGHNFGVNSKEVQDTYLRLDKNIAALLEFLDTHVGKNEYLVFLTSDHGAIHVPAYLKSKKISTAYFDTKDFKIKIQTYVENEYGAKDLIKNISNEQVFFNYKRLDEMKLDFGKVLQKVATFMLRQPNIKRVYTRNQIVNGAFTSGLDGWVKNGFNYKRSGDLVYVLDIAVASYWIKGSAHGSGNSYDTHVPLIFYGKGVKKGSTSQRSEIIDIAPTVATILGISFPNGTTGKPLHQMLD